MLGSEIIEEARERLDDTVSGNYGWSTGELVAYLNDAINELCEKAHLIEDKSTPSICSIPITSGVAEYPISPKIISIKMAQLASNRILYPTTEEILTDFRDSSWLIEAGEVTYYIPNYDRKTITLYRIPTSNDTLILTVYRYPLTPFTESNIYTLSPEINERWHFSLTFGIMYHAYLKNDMDLQNFPNFSTSLNMWQKTIKDAQQERLVLPRVTPVMRGLL